jgi:hypothetical protein
MYVLYIISNITSRGEKTKERIARAAERYVLRRTVIVYLLM